MDIEVYTDRYQREPRTKAGTVRGAHAAPCGKIRVTNFLIRHGLNGCSEGFAFLSADTGLSGS
jgi:hypothetical protein